MSFRSKLARFGQCDQVMPIPLVATALQPSRPMPMYPPIPPKVVSIVIGEYPPKERPLPGDILANNTGFMPPGYLLCDGSAVSRTTYEVLYKIIGTYYGDGDLSTTFNVPKLNNECAPNVTYIIKYDLYSDTIPYYPPVPCPNPEPAPPAIINIQILPYPISFVPPPGTILMNTTQILPEGYLSCTGEEVSRTTYAILYNMIGTYYGEGDGSTTFNLPNLTNGTSTYIIRYANPSQIGSDSGSSNGGTICSGTGTNGGTTIIQGPIIQANVQILPYPLPYVPTAGTILNNTTQSLPDGYLSCDGSAISRTTYSVLFAMIGTFYGEGNGSTTFNLPSLSIGTAQSYTYIIRYLNPSALSVAASTTVQILPYPQPYVPSPGTILSNSTNTIPFGYLGCDGSAVSRATYSVLFAMIGTFYGQGDGSTTFNVPGLSNGTGVPYSYIIRYANPDASIPSLLSTQILPYPLGYAAPPGMILHNTENYLPNGYLACDGSIVSRVEYYILFGVIGEHYGAGDGSTTFKLPSLSIGTGALYTYIICYIDQIIPCVTITPNLNVSGIELPLTGLNLT